MTPTKILTDRLQPAMRRGDRAGIAAAIRDLVKLRAPIGEQWQALAGIAVQNGEIALGRAAIDLFVEARGGTPTALYFKAGLLEQCGAMAEADALLRTLPENVPSPAANAYSRGTAALFLGNVEEARECLLRAVQLEPQAGHGWLSLAMASRLTKNSDIAEAILAAKPHAASMQPVQRAAYFHALGQVHDARGDHDEAFAAFAQGAQTLKATAPFDPDLDRRRAMTSLEGFDEDTLSGLAATQTEQTGRTIFVTGLPRTGTTLVEQILTSHSAVSHGGEIGRLPLIAAEIAGHSQPALAAFAKQTGTPHLAQLWHRWLDERFPGSTRVADKSLTSTRFLGLAAAVLPDAPLIWMTRDPLDTAWSCFRTFLPVGHQWTCDLENIARTFRLEQALLDHWRGVLGSRLLVVPYEDLVSDPASWTRSILAHCGLAEEPQVFTPHENKRHIGTASVMQVRQPINRKAIGSAQPYREHLKPFLNAFEA